MDAWKNMADRQKSYVLCFSPPQVSWKFLQRPSDIFVSKNFQLQCNFCPLKETCGGLLKVQTLRMDVMEDLSMRTCCLTDFRQFWVGQMHKEKQQMDSLCTRDLHFWCEPGHEVKE